MPAALGLRNEGDEPLVDQIQLHVGMRCAVGGPLAAADLPAVADEPLHQIQLSLVEDFPLADLRPADDHLENATVPRRPDDVIQPRFEFARSQMSHDNGHRYLDAILSRPS